MKKIRMKTLDAGPDRVRPAGWVGDIEDKEAGALIAGGYAEEVETRAKPASAQKVKPAAETATKPPTQKATKSKGEKRVEK